MMTDHTLTKRDKDCGHRDPQLENDLEMKTNDLVHTPFFYKQHPLSFVFLLLFTKFFIQFITFQTTTTRLNYASKSSVLSRFSFKSYQFIVSHVFSGMIILSMNRWLHLGHLH